MQQSRFTFMQWGKKRKVSPDKNVDMKPIPTAPHLTAGTQWAAAHCPLTLMDKIMECNNGAPSRGLQTPNVHHCPPCHWHRHINTQVTGGEGPRLWYQTLILFLPPLYIRETHRGTDIKIMALLFVQVQRLPQGGLAFSQREQGSAGKSGFYCKERKNWMSESKTCCCCLSTRIS